MKKTLAGIIKERIIIFNDKVGLILMFGMPILLVLIITLVQNSAFNMITENKVPLIIQNLDKGTWGDSLTQILKTSGGFDVKTISKNVDLNTKINDDNEMLGIQIPEHFSIQLDQNATNSSAIILNAFGLDEEEDTSNPSSISIQLHHDPALQENYALSTQSVIQTIITNLENQRMMELLFEQSGSDDVTLTIGEKLAQNRIQVSVASSVGVHQAEKPNASQHNIPAWTIFAMFFMVVSLGGNIVKEKLSGSFIRIKTIPNSFASVLTSKVIIYLIIAFLQVTVIFSIGVFIFPLLGLPQLNMPENILGFLVITFLSAIAAISFALLIGIYSKTQEQANGIGAVSIIIFAAIGGIWVPSFVLSQSMQMLGKISPLHWCIEGYYAVFLRGGEWSFILPSIIYLIIFILACQILVYTKLKLQNFI